MTAILVLVTFLLFVLFDHWFAKQRVLATSDQAHRASDAAQADVIEGFRVPAGLRYHPGHVWALPEAAKILRAGIDQFGAFLAGEIDQIQVPATGTWVRQGQPAIRLTRNSETIEVLSPVEGEVVEINRAVLDNPELLRKDPYGEGWIFRVYAPDQTNVVRNLIPTAAVPAWMRDAVAGLYALQPNLAGSVAAEGGEPADDLPAALGLSAWKKTIEPFFLTGDEKKSA